MKSIIYVLVIFLFLTFVAGQAIQLNPERTIEIAEKITPATAQRVVPIIQQMDRQTSDEPIYILIFSEGGDVETALKICKAMQSAKHKIVTVGLGWCYSAGATILSSGTKGYRYLAEDASVMIHGPKPTAAGCCFIPLPLGLVKSLGLTSLFTGARYYEKQIFPLLAANTGKSYKRIAEDCKTDKYFTAEGAVEYGLADYVIKTYLSQAR